MNTIAFSYSSEEHVASCIINYNNLEFIGIAECHPDDMDFASERTGCAIAEARARIQMLRYIRDGELKPTLKSYKHLMSCMKTSKYFDPTSYEAKMIRSTIKQLEEKLSNTKLLITREQADLKDYIKSKDDFYKRIRKART